MTLFAVLMAMSLLTVGCSGKYSEVKQANAEFVDVVEDYVADVDKVENAADAAKAINRFADGMEKVMPKMQALAEKFPELEGEDLPAELRELQAETEEVSQKMVASMMKIMNYMQDPEVMKAQERLVAMMSEQ